MNDLFERVSGTESQVTLTDEDCALVIKGDGSVEVHVPMMDDDHFLSSEGPLFKVAVLNAILSDQEFFYNLAMQIMPADETSGCRSDKPECEGCPGKTGGECQTKG